MCPLPEEEKLDQNFSADLEEWGRRERQASLKGIKKAEEEKRREKKVEENPDLKPSLVRQDSASQLLKTSKESQSESTKSSSKTKPT